MRSAALLTTYDQTHAAAIEALHNEGLILFPTDTIWVLGCNACDPVAVQRIYNLKQRAIDNPFVLLVDSIEMLKRYVVHIHPKIETLLVHHRRPLTVVYDQAKNLPKSTIAADGSISIRIPQDAYCQSLIRTFGKPLIATSANISGDAFPNVFADIRAAILEGVDYIETYRQTDSDFGTPSVVIRLNNKEELEFLRE